MKRSGTEWVILLIALVGIALSAYAVTLHYAPTESSICNISASINCDKVNKSPWAVFLGVPVAILGLLSYLAVFLITLKRRAIARALAFTRKDFAQYFLLMVGVMLAFQAYLTWVEIFRIGAYCIVCLASQACILAIAILAWREYQESSRENSKE